MLSIIGGILVVIGAVVVGTIVLRASARWQRLPAPSEEAAPTPAVRELRVKERILLERLRRRMHGAVQRVGHRSSSVLRRWESDLQRGYRRLRLLAQEYVTPSTAPKEITCDVHLTEAEAASAREEHDIAEEHLLACLKLDPKHRGAYLGLAALYQTKKEDGLAEETLRFLRKLYPHDADIAAQLAWVLHGRGKGSAALKEIQAALVESPRNPRYLDSAVELAIVEQNIRLAGTYLEQLREANPENQKLQGFEERVNVLRKKK